MKRSFNQYTDRELLTLDNETINDAIRIEAIERGIAPPMVLSEAITKSEWRGYTKPTQFVAVWEIWLSGKYNSPSGTGLCYLSEEQAMKAIEGAAYVDENQYGKGGPKLITGTASVMKKLIGENPGETAAAKLEEYAQDDTKFNEVKEECVARLSKVRQDDYTRRVNGEKRAEYLRLAGGNEDIARGFWSKVERTEWPEDEFDLQAKEIFPDKAETTPAS